MSKPALIIALNAALVLSASAGQQQQDQKSGQPGGIASTKTLDWNEFKESCTNPHAFQNQIAPSNIHISCSDVCNLWQATNPGSLGLPASRTVRTEVFSDKYHVAAEEGVMPVSATSAACPVFKEVQQTVTVEKAVSCNDLLSFKGDLRDYCAMSLDQSKGSNPRLVKTMDTGRIMDTCGAASVVNKGAGQDLGKPYND